MKALWKKILEAGLSVFPVFLAVLILQLTPLVSFTPEELLTFVFSAVALVLGISLFNLGADVAMVPMGEHIGAGLTKTRSVGLLLGIAFFMGLFITVAEPDLSVLAAQLSGVIDGTVLIVTVGVGVGLFLLIAVLKIIFRKTLSSMLLLFYLLLFAVASLLILGGNSDFLSLTFDTGGVTTGPITVPFIMALGVGIAATIGGRNRRENSFGLIALCSVGPILAVAILGLTIDGSIPYEKPDYAVSLQDFWLTVLSVTKEIGIALGLIVLFFVVLQIFFLRLPAAKLKKIAVGILYTFVGLVVFLVSVTVGFMPIGYKLGTSLGESLPPWTLVLCGLILGAAVVLAEPAVHVLNKQVEEITDRTVSRRSMLIALSVGVGISIALSMLRIVFDFNIMYYLVPGYILSLALSFFVPEIYTAIAFDSGGVASGPLTSSFILPFAIGVCSVLQGDSRIMSDAFGIVAMVAMTPLITIQLLGFRAVMAQKVRDRIAMKRILEKDDEQIINFM